jgi:hypothetical protein
VPHQGGGVSKGCGHRNALEVDGASEGGYVALPAGRKWSREQSYDQDFTACDEGQSCTVVLLQM